METNLYKSGDYTCISVYGMAVVFCIVLLALVMLWPFRPCTLLSHIQHIGRNILSLFWKIQLPTPRFCIYAVITTPLFINPLPLCCHCLHLDWLRRLRPLVSKQENCWNLKYENISRLLAFFLKSCWGVVIDYIFINFIKKKERMTP